MASFWAPLCAAHPWVLLTFLPQAELEALAPICVEPPPDTTLRVFLVWQGLQEARLRATDALPLANAAAACTTREGRFVAVEWGGAEVHGLL